MAKIAIMATRHKADHHTNLPALDSSRRLWANREPASITATEAKNEFGSILEKAIQGQVVVITKHDAPRAVLMSIVDYNTLSGSDELKLDSLSGEFDALLARMQTTKSRSAMKAAFNASPVRLGKAALAAARKRG
jgi:prevent-host-death family protein